MVRGAENRRLRYSDLIGWGVRAGLGRGERIEISP